MGSVNAPMFIKHLHRQICYGVQRHFQQYFSYIVAVSFIGGGDQSTIVGVQICELCVLVISIDDLFRHCEVYSIQLYVIIRLVVSFGTLVSATNKADRHDIAKILLKVALNTITNLSVQMFNKHRCIY
jgi:hypothetical protein